MWSQLIRKILLPAHEALLRRPTFGVLRRLEPERTPSPDEVEHHQLQGLIALTQHARREIPFWRDRLPAASEFAAAANLRGALARIPILTRAEIVQHREQMRWRAAPGKVMMHSSSGTTDDNLIFYFDRKRQAWDRALRMRGLNRFGVLPGERQLQIWPMPNYRDPLNRAKDPLRSLRDIIRQGLVFDLRPITPERLDRALDLLESFRPHLVVAYPSWMEALARRSLSTHRSLRLPELRLILSEGELLYDFQREIITSAFGARVAEEFGSHDSGIVANEDVAGRWRLNWEHVCVEVLKEGEHARPGETGELMVTNLHSHVMPFIRYATGDVMTLPAASAGNAGLALVLPKIEGRASDVLLTTQGQPLPTRAVVETLVRATGSAEFCLYQPEADRILCMTTRTGGWVGHEKRVEEILRSAVGSRLKIEWRAGASFQPLKSGKHRFVCSPAAHSLLAHDKEAGLSLSRVWPQRVLDAS